MNFPNGSILDVGCGMGTLSDYINNEQRPKYLGLDISKEAVRIARTKRPGLAFKVANCESFVPRNKFDVVVFNEMLYYTDHLETMKHYIKFLSPNGIFVISIWYSKKVEYLKNSIFADADKLFPKLSLGSIQVSGTTNKQGYSMAVSSHIEAYRANPST
jgi:2-polyprenyl-3-methyl-5-hydroxy-6-metoxy-1,4-benzoquinol methylase